MRIVHYNNKNCLDLKDSGNQLNPFQLLVVATSGYGKGMTTEAIAERWKKTTNGIVIFLNDPKQEAEQSYVMYEPQEVYHLRELKKDGIKKNKYPAKLYHPFTFNLTKKGYLPDIQIYTLSIKDLNREDWSILAETDAETESIKLMERVAEDLPRNDSLFDFLQEIERLTEGKKDKKKVVADPKNWFLKSGGGTAKSVKQIGNMLSSFKRDYFLRKDTCPYKLDWDKILLDNENYHIFLTNWIENSKLRNFLVVCLMGQAIKNAQRLSNLGKLKKPILFIIPELMKVCPEEARGSALFLSKALSSHLVTMRSKAGGMFCLSDTQNWSKTSSFVRGSFNETFYGKLNPEDARIIFKAKAYTSSKRDYFNDIGETYCAYLRDGHEDDGVFQLFYPSHMHKEGRYDWIQMYKKHYYKNMKKYDSLVKEMKKEFDEESDKAKNYALKEEIEQDKEPDKEKEEKPKIQKNKIENKAKEYLYKRAWELKQEKSSYRQIADDLGLKSHVTAKRYCEKYEKKLKDKKERDESSESVENFIGEGVMPEEVEQNFDDCDFSDLE